MALWLVRALMFAPWRISRLASTEWPCRAATCSGVKPSKLQLFTARTPVCRTHIYTDTHTESGLALCFTFLSFTFLSHLMCRRTAGTLAERVTQQSLNLLFILLFLICPFQQETHLHTHSFREGDQLRPDYFPFLLTISTSASATARSSFSTC